MVIHDEELVRGEATGVVIGGKAAGLVRLKAAGLPVPRFLVLPPDEGVDAVVAAWETWGCPVVAVRSSAAAEDGAEHSFAGMYETVLGVADDAGLRRAVDLCRSSAASPRVAAYLARHELEATPVAVVVQELVDAEASAVLFTVDPGDPDRALMSASWGLGEGVVQGLVACDEFAVDVDGVVQARLADKDQAVRLGSTEPVAVAESERKTACFSEAQVQALVARARDLALEWEQPLDIELARVGDEVWWLQARPITQPVPRGRRRLWDNSNIVESYHGLTGPLTYSFASRAYTIVYQLFCKVMGVDDATIQAHADVFTRMIGLIRGRVYYNLNAWYRMVSLLPGYRWNRPFMEQMMGVAEVAGDEEAPETGNRWAALPVLLWKVGGLLWRLGRIERDIASFKQTFDQAESLFRERDLEELDAHELIEFFGVLERRLLWAWSTPIVNDFFVMIFFGLLRSRCEALLPDAPGLANRLLAGDGDLPSTQPARRGVAVARQMRRLESLWARVETHRSMAERRAPTDGDPRDLEARALLAAFREDPEIDQSLGAWLDDFGDRSPDELKLEVPTWRHRPAALLDLFCDFGRREDDGAGALAVRKEADALVAQQLGGVQALLFRRILAQARVRVHEREALRLLRTRVFGMVREIFSALGAHLVAAGALETPRDVFWLTVDEVFGFVRGTSPTVDLGGLVGLRRAEYARWEQEPAPADRFWTWGPVWAHNVFAGRPQPAPEGALSGTPAFGGVVRGRVRRVLDPVGEPPLDGEILVTYRTDPGWLPLFDGAAAILVERGSLLSHSAVVARELGIPTVVAVRGLMERLEGGEEIEVDAGAGTIRLLSEIDAETT